MTSLSEAKCAREAEICHPTMEMVADCDCWQEHEEAVPVEMTLQNSNANAAMAGAFITDKKLWPPKASATWRRY